MGEVAVEVLRNISLDVRDGELLVMVGPSGSGKTTMLNIMGGMDTCSVGEVWYRDQDITREQHLAFGRLFGDLDVHPIVQADEPLIQAISAERIKKSAAGVKGYTNCWQSDETFRQVPPFASILRAVQVPDIGGDTVFADAIAAYEGLSHEVKERLERLEAVHSLAYGFAWADTEKWEQLNRQFPPVTHPVVRTHPETGEKILYVNYTFTTRILGVSEEDSERLLRLLFERIKVPEYQVRFRWAPNAIGIWDNRSTQHYAVGDYWPEDRVLERVTVSGDVVRR